MGSNQGAGSRRGAEGPAPASRGAVSLLPAEGPPTWGGPGGGGGGNPWLQVHPRLRRRRETHGRRRAVEAGVAVARARSEVLLGAETWALRRARILAGSILTSTCEFPGEGAKPEVLLSRGARSPGVACVLGLPAKPIVCKIVFLKRPEVSYFPRVSAKTYYLLSSRTTHDRQETRLNAVTSFDTELCWCLLPFLLVHLW